MKLLAVDFHQDCRQHLLEFLQPKIIFHEEVANGEAKLVYMILMDFLRATGLKIKISERKPLSVHVAEVLKISENQSELEEGGMKFGLELTDEARIYSNN